jgi:hypothetical protein
VPDTETKFFELPKNIQISINVSYLGSSKLFFREPIVKLFEKNLPIDKSKKDYSIFILPIEVHNNNIDNNNNNNIDNDNESNHNNNNNNNNNNNDDLLNLNSFSKFIVARRFKEFSQLNDALRRYFPCERVPRFPSKTFVGGNQSAGFLRSREAELHTWSKQVIERFYNFKLVQLFFHLDCDGQQQKREYDDSTTELLSTTTNAVEALLDVDEKFASLREVFDARQTFLRYYYEKIVVVNRFPTASLDDDNVCALLTAERVLLEKIIGTQQLHFLARTAIKPIDASKQPDSELFGL